MSWQLEQANVSRAVFHHFASILNAYALARHLAKLSALPLHLLFVISSLSIIVCTKSKRVNANFELRANKYY